MSNAAAMLTKDNHKYQFSFPVGDWHQVFCFLPKRTWDGRFIWFRFAERRMQQMYEYLYPDGDRQWFEYHLK